MRLCELSPGYRAAALPLKNRLRELRQRLKAAQDPAERASLRHEIALLATIMTQCRELAELTARQQEVQAKLEEMEERWLYLSECAD